MILLSCWWSCPCHLARVLMPTPRRPIPLLPTPLPSRARSVPSSIDGRGIGSGDKDRFILPKFSHSSGDDCCPVGEAFLVIRRVCWYWAHLYPYPFPFPYPFLRTPPLGQEVYRLVLTDREWRAGARDRLLLLALPSWLGSCCLGSSGRSWRVGRSSHGRCTSDTREKWRRCVRGGREAGGA